jgi:hypothetical protein
MEYCSLEYAFGEANQEAKRQERRKAKRCKGPALAFVEPQGEYLPDPDRPAVVKQKPLPAMNSSTGLREHAPTEADVGTLEAFEERTNTNTNKNSHMKVQGNNEVSSQVGTPSFFGKDPAENFASFTHVIGDAKEYRLQPDFQDAFHQVGTLSGAGATASLPTPSVRDVWKPLSPTGARTAFFEALPPPLYEDSRSGNDSSGNDNSNLQSGIHSKLDKIFARLDELETNRVGDPSSAQTEVLLFIMSGIFVLFLTDLAVRKGAQ